MRTNELHRVSVIANGEGAAIKPLLDHFTECEFAQMDEVRPAFAGRQTSFRLLTTFPNYLSRCLAEAMNEGRIVWFNIREIEGVLS